MARVNIDEHEGELRRELEQTEEWTLANHAAVGLGQTILTFPATSYEGPAEKAGPALQLAAQRIIGVRMFRAMRAASAVLSIGYEPEARALDRIIVELVAHRKTIQADSTGDEAERWLNGDAGFGITKKVNAMQPEDLYKNLSQDAHGDPRAVWRLYDAESNAFMLGPQRAPFAARASLLMHAGVAVDQTELLGALGQLEITGLDELSGAIRASHGRLIRDGEAAGG